MCYTRDGREWNRYNFDQTSICNKMHVLPETNHPRRFSFYGRAHCPIAYLIVGIRSHRFDIDSEHCSFAPHMPPHRGCHSHLPGHLHNDSLLCVHYKFPSASISNRRLGGAPYDSQLGSMGWKWIWLFCPSTYLFQETQVQFFFDWVSKCWSNGRTAYRMDLLSNSGSLARRSWLSPLLLQFPIFSETGLEHLKLRSTQIVLISWLGSTWATIGFRMYIQPS